MKRKKKCCELYHLKCMIGTHSVQLIPQKKLGWALIGAWVVIGMNKVDSCQRVLWESWTLGHSYILNFDKNLANLSTSIFVRSGFMDCRTSMPVVFKIRAFPKNKTTRNERHSHHQIKGTLKGQVKGTFSSRLHWSVTPSCSQAHNSCSPGVWDIFWKTQPTQNLKERMHPNINCRKLFIYHPTLIDYV